MSSTSFAEVRHAHPELGETIDSVDDWLENHPNRTFLDARAITRDLSDRLTGAEIYEFFTALKKLGIARVSYRVIDPHGAFTRTERDSYRDIPSEDVDQYGDIFEVRRENIVQVFTLKP